MTSIEKLRVLGLVTQRALDQTLSRSAGITSKFLAERKKLDYLRSVAEEYRQNSLIFARQGFDLARLQRQQQFSERLSSAIDEQALRCSQLERDIANIKGIALSQRRRIKTLEALKARQVKKQEALMRSAEQKLTDEYASRNQPCAEGIPA